MWYPGKGIKGSARWVTILACALLLQLGLCGAVPAATEAINKHFGTNLNPTGSLFDFQVSCFWITLMGLVIAVVFMMFEPNNPEDPQ